VQPHYAKIFRQKGEIFVRKFCVPENRRSVLEAISVNLMRFGKKVMELRQKPFTLEQWVIPAKAGISLTIAGTIV
jgi:hypothetical protein